MEEAYFDKVLDTVQSALEKQRVDQGFSSVRPIQEQIYLNYYFNPSEVVLGTHGSLFQVNKKILNLHDKKIRISYVNPIIELDKNDFRKVISDLSHRDLITLVRSDKNDMLEEMGFEAVVEHKVCNIPAQILPEFDVQGIVLSPPTNLVKDVFDKYSQHFTGYFERTLHDFECIIRDTQFAKGKVVGFMKNDEMVGYIRSIHHGSYVEVIECCYDTSGTLMRLLSFVSKGVNRIIYNTSASEKIHKILPGIKVENKVVMLARINDKELFERLFHIKIISSYSAFNAFSKPVLNMDVY